MHSWASLVAKKTNSTPIKFTQLTINCKPVSAVNHQETTERTQRNECNEPNVEDHNIEEIKPSEEKQLEQDIETDIDIIDIECDETEHDADDDNDLEQDFSSFLSLTIGERVLLLHIVVTILPHQSAYHLLRCFRRYHKIFGEELHHECKRGNTLWFWKGSCLRDFGEPIFRQERRGRHSRRQSVSQQAKQFAFNKKNSADFWKKHYLSEYRNTATVKYHMSAEWVHNKRNHRRNRKRKQIVETVSFYPSSNLVYASKWSGYSNAWRSPWFSSYALQRVMILSQHKLFFNKIFSLRNIVRCNWFLEIGQWNDIYANKAAKGNPIIVKTLTNGRYFNADVFRGYVNRFDVRCMKLHVTKIMVETSQKCIDAKEQNKKCKIAEKKIVKLKVAELYSDIKGVGRVILHCASEYLQNRNEAIFAFEQMIDFKQLMKDFYENKGKHRPLKVQVLYFERLGQGIMVNAACCRKQ